MLYHILDSNVIDSSVLEEDALYLVNEHGKFLVRRSRLISLSRVAKEMIVSKECKELKVDVNVGPNVMNRIRHSLTTGVMSGKDYDSILHGDGNSCLGDLIIIADFLQIDSLLDIASQMLRDRFDYEFEKTMTPLDEKFTCDRISVRILWNVFPHDLCDASRLLILQSWSRGRCVLDCEAIQMMRNIDPREISAKILHSAAESMDEQFFSFIPFYFFKKNHSTTPKMIGWT